MGERFPAIENITNVATDKLGTWFTVDITYKGNTYMFLRADGLRLDTLGEAPKR